MSALRASGLRTPDKTGAADEPRLVRGYLLAGYVVLRNGVAAVRVCQRGSPVAAGVVRFGVGEAPRREARRGRRKVRAVDARLARPDGAGASGRHGTCGNGRDEQS